MVGMFAAWSSLIFTNNNLFLQVDKIANIVGCTTLTGILLYRWATAHYFPISNLYESMLFLAWGLSLGSIVIRNFIKTRLISSIITLGFGITFFISTRNSAENKIQTQDAFLITTLAWVFICIFGSLPY